MVLAQTQCYVIVYFLLLYLSGKVYACQENLKTGSPAAYPQAIEGRANTHPGVPNAPLLPASPLGVWIQDYEDIFCLLKCMCLKASSVLLTSVQNELITLAPLLP